MAQHPDFSTHVEAIAEQLGGLICLLAAPVTPNATPDGIAAVERIAAVESIGRLVDAARVRVLAPLARDSSLVERLGFTSPIAAVASIARVSERSARSRLDVAAAVCADRAITGAALPAPRPVAAAALDSGQLGLDAAALITRELHSIAGRTPADVLDVAESAMVGLATGVSPTGEPVVATVSVDYLATEIRQVTAAADPDGARPREERAARRRELRIGMPDEDGLIPINGRLVPWLGSLLVGMIEAHRRSPRFEEAPDALALVGELPSPAESRTPGQRRHDALAEIVMAAASAEGAPHLDGAPVTVIVTVAASDLTNEDGLDGDPIGIMVGSPFPVSRRSVERFIDAGGNRVVTLGAGGVVVGIGSPQRCFTPLQRLGIAARDGLRCSTPGCTSPHFTLQAHHVIPDRDGGPTAIDNGILLCYWHHEQVDTGPWQYLMIKGMPYVRGPGIGDWAPTRKPVRMAA